MEEPKIKNVDFDFCVTSVNFNQQAKVVHVSRDYYTDKEDTPAGLIHSENFHFDLRTIPLRVALQYAAGLVQQVGLIAYED